MSGVDEYADSDGDFFGVNEVVEDDRGSVVAIFSDKGVSILKYHQGGRFRGVVLYRHIHIVSTNGSWKDLTVFPDVMSKRAAWDAIVPK